MSPATIMAANRLANNGEDWSDIMAHKNSGTANRQWVTLEPRTCSVRLVEQIPGMTESINYSKKFLETGYLVCTGVPILQGIKEAADFQLEDAILRSAQVLKTSEKQNKFNMQHIHLEIKNSKLVCCIEI